MTDFVTPAKGLTEPTVGSDGNTWGGILNNDLSLIDAALGGTLAITITGNTSLNPTQATNTGYVVSGSTSGSTNLVWPAYRGLIAVKNSTGNVLVCKLATGLTVSVANGESVAIWSTGTDFLRLAQAPIALPLGVASGGTGNNFSATGGAHQVLTQPSTGSTIQVAQLSSSDIAGLAPSATVDATNAGNITSGTLAIARGGTGTSNSTGSGSLVLSGSPTISGTLSTGAISANGVIVTSAQGSRLGQAGGNETAPTPANTNLLLYDNSTTNWSGIGAHTDGTMYFVTGTAGVATRMTIDPGGSIVMGNNLTVANNISGTWTGAPVAVAHGGTGATSAAAAFTAIACPASSFGGNGSPGYIKFTNGLTLQWGVTVISTNGAVSYPIQFPQFVFNVSVTVSEGFPASVFAGIANLNTSNFTINLNGASTATCFWIAIGI